jgi:hypothetical protein
MYADKMKIIMFEVYDSVIGCKDALYCSTPITSGKRSLEWFKQNNKINTDIDNLCADEKNSHFKQVIEPNCLHAKMIVSRIRQMGRLVIDPTDLSPINEWKQDDWRSFWGQVVERYVTTAIFVNDWQYSKGCIYEFLISHRKGIYTLDENLNIIDLATGIKLITEAKILIENMKMEGKFFEQIVQDMKNLDANKSMAT